MRYRLTPAIAVLATALVAALAPGAGASTNTKISIEPNAQLAFNSVIVGFHYQCAGTGTVSVTVTQSPPESAFPTSATARSVPVACDGRTHEAAVTVCCGFFDAGKAQATAQLVALSGTVTVTRTINIVVT